MIQFFHYLLINNHPNKLSVLKWNIYLVPLKMFRIIFLIIFEEGKRTGFQRSEEVGVPEGLTVSGDYLQTPFMKQTSRESTDSSHSDKLVIRLVLDFLAQLKAGLNFDLIN